MGTRDPRTHTGRAKRKIPEVPHPPRKTRRGLNPDGTPRLPPQGSKKTKQTDVTIPPQHIDAITKAAKKLGVTRTTWHRAAIKAYAAQLAAAPIEPRPTHCAACGTRFKPPRSQGDFKRQREMVYFDDDTITLISWIADTFYHGVWSQAFEAAVDHYLGEDAPGRVAGYRPR